MSSVLQKDAHSRLRAQLLEADHHRRRELGLHPVRPASRVLLWAFVGFLALEYLRPEMLQPLRLQLLFVLGIPVAWAVSRERPWSWNLTLQMAFIATGLVMLPFAHNNYEVYRNFRFMFGFFVTALATTWLLANLVDFRRILWFWIGLIFFQACWAITHDGHGYGAFLGDENDLALACDVALPFAFIGAQMLRGWRRMLCAAVAAVLVAGVVSSLSRGGFLGLLAGALYCVMASPNRLRTLILGAAAAGVLFLAMPSDYMREIQSIRETRSGTAEGRRFLWAAATMMWMDNPILGVGPFNAKYRLGEYKPEPTSDGMFASRDYTDRVWSMTALHSLYFELLSERGIVGCVLFGWIVLCFYRELRRLRKAATAGQLRPQEASRDAQLYALALEASLAAYLVAGAFLSMLYYPYFWFLTALGIAFERAVRGTPFSDARHPGSHERSPFIEPLPVKSR